MTETNAPPPNETAAGLLDELGGRFDELGAEFKALNDKFRRGLILDVDAYREFRDACAKAGARYLALLESVPEFKPTSPGYWLRYASGAPVPIPIVARGNCNTGIHVVGGRRWSDFAQCVDAFVEGYRDNRRLPPAFRAIEATVSRESIVRRNVWIEALGTDLEKRLAIYVWRTPKGYVIDAGTRIHVFDFASDCPGGGHPIEDPIRELFYWQSSAGWHASSALAASLRQTAAEIRRGTSRSKRHIAHLVDKKAPRLVDPTRLTIRLTPRGLDATENLVPAGKIAESEFEHADWQRLGELALANGECLKPPRGIGSRGGATAKSNKELETWKRRNRSLTRFLKLRLRLQTNGLVIERGGTLRSNFRCLFFED